MYYIVTNHYPFETSPKPHKTVHVVRCNSPKEAISLCEKYGIAKPFGREPTGRTARKLNENNWFDNFTIYQRRKGIGGRIFYEENGELKTE